MANSFTPQQIEEFLQEFFDVVGARQYVGARYVPIFGRMGEDTVEWDDRAPYEPLTVVMHLGVSYVSRQYVPTGTPITDTDFWVETYRFNAQVEQYRQEVLSFQGQIDDRVPFPIAATYPRYGELGQVLTTLANGQTKWEDPVIPSDEQAEQVITSWLDQHPEATTTVQDNSLTTAKYVDGSVTDAKLDPRGTLAVSDGAAENLVRYNACDMLLFCPRIDKEHGGITFEFNDDGSCHVSGTDAANRFYDFFIGDEMPPFLSAGGTYEVTYSATNVSFRVYVYQDHVLNDTPIFSTHTNGTFTLPNDTTGVILRLLAASNTAINETVNPKMLVGTSNADILSLIGAVEDSDALALHVRYGAWSGTDANDIDENCALLANGPDVANLPDTTNAYVVWTVYTVTSHNNGYQIAYDYATGKMWYRQKFQSIWRAWRDYPTIAVKYGAWSGTDANDINENCAIVAVGSDVSNLPTTNRNYALWTMFTSTNQSNGYQIAYDLVTGRMWYRQKSQSSWLQWQDKEAALDEVVASDALAYHAKYGTWSGTDANDVDENCTLIANGANTAHLPNTSDGFVLVTIFSVQSHNNGCQIAYNYQTGEPWYRRKFQGSWNSWRIPSDNRYKVTGKYVAFGDSVTWSSIWDYDQQSGFYQAAKQYQIPTRIAVACGMQNSFENQAVGSTGYYAEVDDENIVDRIKAYNFTGVDLVTVMGGVNDKNDANHPLGTAADPASGTICGAIKEIIDWFSSNYAAVQLVIIQPSPSGHLADPWNGTQAAGWSLNSFDEQVSQLCADNHVGYVNWNDCTLAKNWDQFSGGYSHGNGPNYSHMATENDCARIGDYLAGKVSQFFHGSN